MVKKKLLPDDVTIKRLYWFEEMSCQQIGDRYGVTESAVRQRMMRVGIPRRSQTRHRHTIMTECIECGKPTCYAKRWVCKRGDYIWAPTIRCAEHHRLKIRQLQRDGARRRRGTPELRYRGPQNRKLPMSWERQDLP